ncbi:MAG: 16S rRNA (adenine(1518)-N(6)/adenine(1519)-N(6))-dimethyltransferase RsmA [Planctomycetota bacterium]|jgi:16S rRNA (adenine1518-N6/adenine1519-N6)-dimethyltransferase
MQKQLPMEEAVRQTRTHLIELFKKHGFNPRGDLGQNFLIDLNIIEFVVREAELTKQDIVLEVGSGTGGMTTFMAIEAGHVVSVEYDTNMYQLAHDQTEYLDNVTLLNVDALKTKSQIQPVVIEELRKRLKEFPGSGIKLVANLPYNIATPLISNLVATELPWERIVATIQLELAERMIATPGRGKYGALSVWLQSQCKVKLIKRMSPKVFWPRPAVDSAVVKIAPLPEKRDQINDRAFFHDFVRRVFHQRRKLLRGVVCGMYRKQLGKSAIDALLVEEGLSTEDRAEEMTPEQLVSLSNRLHGAIVQR